MKELLEFIVRNLVDRPEHIQVTAREEGRNVQLEIKVAKEDTGKIIGKNGRVIRAIRIIVRNMASRERKNANVVVV